MAKGLFRSSLHEHADPARRVAGVAELPPDSDELASLLAGDPAVEVRVAAAARCTDVAALGTALAREADPGVQAAIATSLASALATTPDEAAASALLAADGCTDAIRANVARSTHDAARRRSAIAAMRDEAALIDVALTGLHAETRLAAAERVATPEGLRKLADAAKNKDHGVARIARKRIDAIDERAARAADADAILAQLEALAGTPGPILSAVIELNRRWEALGLADDPARLARGDAARQALQARFDREHDEARARARLERRVSDWLAQAPPETAEALAERRTELAALRAATQEQADAALAERLDGAQQRIAQWTAELQAVAGAEALVAEAEQLAAGTSIDHAKLPERWQALDRAIRTPALTRRFEAALIVVEQRRLAQVRAAEQEAQAAKQKLHALLHTAEQALAAGQLQPARAAADEIRALKPSAGTLPRPTVQRLGRLTQQLGELERWESFGQQQARVQLCERAEAAGAPGDPARVAAEVQKLRNEWKALDAQHAGVPKALWERFDRACEKAYAPAARHFAEQAALRKQARKQREDFIAGVAAHAPTLLAEPRDWRALERWMRETEHRWHGAELGSVEPKAWKAFDARFREALAPVRDALATARDGARARRQALIDEVTALAANAAARDAPSQVKAIQEKWQAQAKEITLGQRDERALWEQFRTACDAVFQARHAKRREEDDRKHAGRRALESVCAELEQLAKASERDEHDVRRAARELQEKWRQASRTPDPSARALESRFRSAKTAVDAALAERARVREAAVWRVLAAKERVCDELDRLARAAEGGADTGSADAAASVASRWSEAGDLPPAWEKVLAARRDGAAAALADGAAAAYAARIAKGADARREMLLELEMLLGLDSPPELNAQRLALQVRRLRERFQSAATSGADTARERLVAWCAQPGVVDARDRERCDRIFAVVERGR